MRQWIIKKWWSVLLPLALALALAPAGHAANSVVRAVDMTVARGGTNHVYIVLDSVGTENGVELSLCFDKNLLTYVSAVRGVDSAGSTFFSNVNQLSNGRLGLFLGLPTDVAFEPGARNIIDVTFSAAAGVSSAVTTITICDLPLGRETVNVEATPIPTDYVNATVTIVGSCSYSISPVTRNHGPGAATNGVTLTTSNSCPWSINNTNAWILFSTAASGSGSFSNVYSVLANPNPTARTGIVQIADQVFTIIQDPVACSYSLSPKSRSHGNGAAANTVGVTTSAGCNWTATTTNNWILLQSGTNGPGDGTVGYSVLANPNASERIGSIMVADQFLVLTQKAASCTVAVNPTSVNHAFGATNSTFDVTSAGGCTWTVSNTNSWVTLTSSTNGSSNATIHYSLTANGTTARSGNITVVGASNSVTFAINQAGTVCSYLISPTNGAHSVNAETGSVSVTTSVGCAWSVNNSNSWITVTTPTNNNSGPGTVTYTVAANPGSNMRTGVLVIASQPYVVTQAGFSCGYSLSPVGRSHGYGVATNTVILTTTAGCAWTISNPNSWITIETAISGSGSFTNTYSVLANPNPVARTGVVVIAGQTLTITQDPLPCTYSLSPKSRSHGSGAATNTVGVTAGTTCPWTATTTNTWILLQSGTNGPGNGTVTYAVLSNPNAAERLGAVFIGDQSLVLTQKAASCTVSINPSSNSHASGAANGSFDVASAGGCSWTVSNTNSWITLTSSTNGSGNATINYTVAANISSGRSAVVTVVGVSNSDSITINQSGGSCSYSLSAAGAAHTGNADTGTVSVTTSFGCNWTVSNTNAWITLLSATNNSSSGTVTYSVASNLGQNSRTGTVVVAGQNFVVTQTGVSCGYALSPVGRSHGYGVATNTVILTTTAGCAWTVSNPNSWITFETATSGSGSFTNTYNVQANPNPVARTGVVVIAGQTLTLTQDPLPCTYSLSPKSRSHGSGAATNTVGVTAGATCPWTTTTTNTWILLQSGTNGPGNGTVTYAVLSNPNGTERVGAVFVGDQSLVLTQKAASCTVAVNPTNVSHGASATNSSFDVTSAGGCPWTISNTNSWVTLTSSTNGSGNATINYTLSANAFGVRSGVITVVGASNTASITINQDVLCSFSLSPKSRSHGNGAATNTVGVTVGAGCAWTATTTNNWILLQSGTNGPGTGTVTYAISSNPNAAERVGAVFIGDQSLILTQKAASCSVAVTPGSASHAVGATNSSFGVTSAGGCSWNVNNTNSWITITSSTNGSGNSTVNYALTANVAGPRSALITVIGASNAVNITVNQAGVACLYDLSPTSRTHGFGAATNSVTLAVSNGCAWSIGNTNPWISILSAMSGSGNATIDYSVLANPNQNERTGRVTIADQVLTIIQHAVVCDFSLSPTNRTHGFSSTTNSVVLDAPGGCPWTVSNTNGWITITSATNGSGSNVVGYVIQENLALVDRTGTVMIGGQTFMILQHAATCDISLSPTNRPHGYGAATGTVSVATAPACSWDVVNTNNWISFDIIHGTGSNLLTYIVVANPSMMERTGVVLVADAVLTLIQHAAPCTYDLSTGTRTHGYSAATNSVTLTAPIGCMWTVSSTNGWITITSATNGSGNATINYVVATNPDTFNRTGVVYIADQTLTLRQTAAPCPFVFSPSNATFAVNGGTGMVSIATTPTCPWDVVNTNSWITIATSTNGLANGSVGYSVSANPSPIPRSGFLLIGGETFLVSEAGVPCNFSLTPSSRAHGAGIESNSFTVTTSNTCPWTVTKSNSWISITSGATGSGSGTVNYTVDANPTLSPRSTTLVVGGELFTINQQGATCSYRLSPTNRTHGTGAATGTVAVTAIAGCDWNVSTADNWISIQSPLSGNGTGIVTYAVAGNTNFTWRTGMVQIADQSLVLIQQPAVCAFSVSPTNRTHGNGTVTNSIAVTAPAACAWTAVSSNSWITFFSPTNVNGNGSVNYTVETNQSIFWRTGTLLIAEHVVTLAQRPTPCAFFLSPSNAVHGSGDEIGFVQVTGPSICPWSVDNTNTWITLMPDLSGMGNGNFSYEISPNPLSTARTGLVFVVDQILSIVQSGAPCSYTLAPLTRAHVSGASTGTVSVTALAGCDWTVVNTNPWVTVVSGTNGSGNGTVTYTVATNVSSSPRTGAVVIASQVFSVTQSGATCTYTLSPLNRTHTPAVETGTVSVTSLTGCPWGASTTNTWITILPPTNGSGNGTVTYSVATNTTSGSRTGTIQVDGQTFTVNQSASCTFVIAPTSRSYGSVPTNGSVTVTTQTGCTWTVANSNSWIQITSATNGTGNGTVTFNVSSNGTAITRNGLVTIAGQPFTITQSGAPCSYVIAPTNRAYGPNATNGTVAVTAIDGCDWTVSNTNSWISFPSGTNGTGTANADYTVAAIQSSISRTGVVIIATKSFTLVQTGATCSYTLSLSNRTHGAGVETGSVDVVSLTGCTWTASNTNTWITILSATNGTGNGTVTYSVASNNTASARIGLLTIGGRSFTVNQDPAACTFVIAPTSRSYSWVATNGSVNVTSLVGCAWTALNTNPWISITSSTNGSGNGSVAYTVVSNATSSTRVGNLTIAGQNFAVTQSGAPCTYALSITNRSYGSGATNGSVLVTTLDGCVWGTTNTNNWITLTGLTNGIGTGTVDFAVSANASSIARTGIVFIASQSLTVTQAGVTCTYNLSQSSRNHGSGAENGTVDVISPTGCSWTVNNTNTWITISSGTNGSGSSTVSYAVASNLSAVARSGSMTIAGKPFTVTQDAGSCTYTLNPTLRNHGSGAETSTVAVTTLTGCSWSATITNSWILVVSNASGSGNGTMGYSVTANPSSTGRTGTVVIAGQSFTVTQAGAACVATLTPISWVHHAVAETGTVSVAMPAGCNWASSTNSTTWISILSGGSGSGDGTVTYAVAANTGASERFGLMTIAGQTFAVSQLSTNCGYKISPTTRFHGSGAMSNTVSLTASNGCSWSVINTNPWVTILSNASGSGSMVIGYSVSSNRNPGQRVGVLNIGGEYLTLTQWGTNCGLALTPSSRAHSGVLETGLVTVTTSTSNCTWTTINTNGWITINSGASGTGNGSVGYTVTAFTSNGTRSGNITVNGEIFTVTQTGQPCSYAIAPASRTHGGGAESSSIAVTAGAGCTWTTSNSISWFHITSGASGSGDGTVNYSVDANPTGLQRTGVVTVAGQSFGVTQSGATCTFTVSVSNQNFIGTGGTGTVAVSTLTGCTWTTDNTNTWILLTTSPGGTGNGSIGYSVDVNPSSIGRTGVVTVAGRVLTVTQSGQACSYSIGPTSRVHPGTADTGMVTVTSILGCSWTASNTNTWVTLTTATNGIGSGSIGYSVSANPSLNGRTGVVVVAGQNFTITQLGASCSYTLVPTSRAHGSGVETGSLGVAVISGCTWSVSNTNTWIQITSGASGNGSGTVGYSVDVNPGSNSRTGVVSIAGQAFTVTQAGLFCGYVLTPTSRAHSPSAETSTVAVAASTGCTWSVANTNSWIVINAGASGNGNGTVTYAVLANPGLPRSGNLVIGGQVFAVNQSTTMRLLRIVNMNVLIGQTNKLPVVLNSSGDENGIGFSVCYDTNVLQYVRAVRGNEATNAGATLNVNTGSTNRGRVGLAMALNTDAVFTAGSNTVVEVFFRAAPGTNAVSTSVSLCDLPLGRDVVDVLGDSLPTSYSDGIVNIVGNCTYALAATSGAFNEAGGNGSVGVTAGTGCTWTVSNTNSWITMTSGSGGTGSGTVTFTVAPNGSIVSRTGVVVIAGQSFTVSQSAPPCTYILMPLEQAHGFNSETGSVGLTTLSGCPWSASSGASWISILAPTNGAGSATVNYSVDPNPSSIGRTGAVTVAGQLFTVRQSGVPCSYSLSPTSRAHGSGSETGSSSVTAPAGCVWTAVSGSSWITITGTGAGAGNGSFNYSVGSNPNLGGRTGLVSVAGQNFTVTQAGNPCAVTLSPTNNSHVASGGTGMVSVIAANGCTWTVSNSNSWVTLTSSTNGTGNGSFGYSIVSNPSGSPRVGFINVAGQAMTISQAGADCVFAIAPTERGHGSGSEAGLVSVATFPGCGWSVSNGTSWITINSPTTNMVIGSGSVSYSVSANPSGLGRTGIVLIAGTPLTVTQSGAACSYAISPTSRSHGFGVESGSITLNSVIGCPWTVVNSNAWILITSETSGSGPWGVNYTVTNNPTGLSRTGVVTIAGQPFTVTQAPAPCSYSISPTTRSHGSGATNNTVTVNTLVGCPYVVTNTNSWISIQTPLNTSGPGPVAYTVDENTTAFGRTGTVSIAGFAFTVTQLGATCSFSISPTNRGHGYAATTNTVDVTSITGCPWTISNTNTWLNFLSGTNGTGSVTVTYSVASNQVSSARTGIVTVAGKTLTLIQTGAPCIYLLSPGSATPTAEAQNLSVSVTVPGGCPWTASNTNSWITLTSSTNGSGNGIVNYSIVTNSSAVERSGYLTIAGQPFLVTQMGMVCMFSLSPTNGSVTSGNVTGLVSVVTSPSCAWTIINTNTWIAIKSPATESGVGTTLIKYTAAANPNPSVRNGNMIIGGVVFPVSQVGTPCNYSLSPSNRLHGSGTETNAIGILTVAECSWQVVNTNSWITILSATNGSGNGSVSYFIDANPASLDRTGMVMVAGLPYTVTQLGAVCLYSLTSSNTGFGPLTTTGSVNVAATPGCTWSVVNSNTWITINSGASGTNNGIVRFTVANNFNPALRSGNLRIGGQTISISQTGILCTFTISPTNATHGPAPENGTLSVLTSNLCPWSVVNTNPWITLLSPTNSSGNTNVYYSVALNLSPFPRTGQFTVGGQTYTVTQNGIICTFTVSPASSNHTAYVESGQISVVTSNICPWTVNNTNSWISILSPTNISGNGTVLYAVATNTSVLPRSGTFDVAGQTYTVNQAGFICTFSLNPPARAHSAGAVTGLVALTTGTGCAWTMSNSNSWITLVGSTNRLNSGLVSYVAALNPGIPARTGIVNIAGQPFTLTQFGTAFIAASNKTVPCGSAWTFDPPVLSGTCSESNLSLTVLSTVTNAGCGSGYTAIRRWDALDGCSNRVTITQTVSVVVILPPVITCASQKNVECGTAWTFDPPTAVESCGGTNVTIVVLNTVTNAAGSCGGTFSATRTWQAIDACTNVSTCSQTVRIVDVTPPTLTCAANRTVPCGSGWNFDAPIVTDNCSGEVLANVVATVTNFAGFCGGTYTATRSWEAIDGCANRSTCSQTITVIDTTAPSLSCSGNKTIECGIFWNFDTPVAIDSCVGTNMTIRVLTTVTNAGACANTFTATRTWEALDSCSNRSTCSQTVTVVDLTPPTLVCSPTRSVEAGATWSFDPPTAVDSCGTNVTISVLSTVTNTLGSCGSTYTVVRTWQAMDGCSNRSATCSQVIQLLDTTPPVLSCITNKIVTCGSGWSFDLPTANDSGGGTNINIVVLSTLTNNAGYCGGTFVAVRTWQAFDACSNSSICSQSVWAIDVTPPVLTCAANKSVPCGTPWSFDPPTVADGCNGTNVTVRIVGTTTNTTGLCAGSSTATRTWEAIDGCTNRSTCSQTVTVFDATPPVLTCVPNKLVECGQPWTFDQPEVTDGCSGTNVTLRIVSTVTNTSGVCGGSLTATRTWEAFDACSNRSTCAQIVLVTDTTPPALFCPVARSVEYGSAWTFDTPTVTDSCSAAGVSLVAVSTVTNTAGACGKTYTVTRTWQAVDACSNRSATCSQLIRVVDTAPPVITCASTKLVSCGIAWTFDAPTATDLVDGTNVTITIVNTVTNGAGSCGGAFIATRTWVATDSCSNSATCSQIVRLVDITPPVLTCPLNKIVPCGTFWTFDAPSSIDACSGTNVTLQVVSTVTNNAGACSGTFTAMRTWESVDGCTNRATCSQIVTVVDTSAPTLTCAGNKSVECGSNWTFDAPVVTDSCAGTNLTLRIVSTITNASGGCVNAVSVSRTWEALDSCSNRSTCVQTVTVVDTTPPVLTCPLTRNVEYNSTWNFDAPTLTDACSSSGLTLTVVSTVTNQAGTCGHSYTVLRTWSASDACGNHPANCSQLIRVSDSTPPIMTCPTNKAVTCDGNYVFDSPTAFDAVDGTNVTIVILSTVTNGTCASGLFVTRTWQASDTCGNHSTCSQSLSAMSIAAIAGVVSYYPTNASATPTSKRLSPVSMIISGGTNMTMQSAADGSFGATLGAGGTYFLTPRLTNSNPIANGVSTLDISLIRRHILNIAPLDSPYKLLAGDVNGSRSVTTLDISLIRRVILGITNTFPAGLWRFVPSDHVFFDPLNPWDAPTNRSYTNLLVPLTNQDFMAIKIGDVNNSWVPPVISAGFNPAAAARNAALASAPEVTFTVSSHTNQPGDTLTAHITASGFRQVTSAQWTLAWDPSVLRYVGTGKYGLKGLASGNFGTSMVDSGRLTFSWDDPDALGLTTTDGTIVFSANFTVIGASGSISPLMLSSSATETEVGVNFSEANLRGISGLVTVIGTNGATIDLGQQPQLARMVFTNGVFGVPQQTVPGRRYTLEYTDTLPTTNWTPLTPVQGDGSVLILSDPGAPARQRFYRLRIE